MLQEGCGPRARNTCGHGGGIRGNTHRGRGGGSAGWGGSALPEKKLGGKKNSVYAEDLQCQGVLRKNHKGYPDEVARHAWK